MILEVAILTIKTGSSDAFESAFQEAQKIISSMEGYVSHELKKCLEQAEKYILLVNWETLEAHTEGFRKSAEYQNWKSLLHHFYEPFPIVEHYVAVEAQKN
ncbi:antibiotic biosynthesis monooxygenase family protein [Pedobacter sp. MW01-1-1]|uniref:antibiotic biosynthesis monooxygenase family protein n=1 Tax=Pedobacter sp. MW01-1-1 TaxID=3383027 RepID=UPI003FEE0D4A